MKAQPTPRRNQPVQPLRWCWKANGRISRNVAFKTKPAAALLLSGYKSRSFVLTKEEEATFFLAFHSLFLKHTSPRTRWDRRPGRSGWLRTDPAPPRVEATPPVWVLGVEKPTACTSRAPPRWLQPRSPTCSSSKPTTSCSCRPSRVSRCSQQVARSLLSSVGGGGKKHKPLGKLWRDRMERIHLDTFYTNLNIHSEYDCVLMLLQTAWFFTYFTLYRGWANRFFFHPWRGHVPQLCWMCYLLYTSSCTVYKEECKIKSKNFVCACIAKRLITLMSYFVILFEAVMWVELKWKCVCACVCVIKSWHQNMSNVLTSWWFLSFPVLTEPTQIYRFLRTRNLIAVSVAFPTRSNHVSLKRNAPWCIA